MAQQKNENWPLKTLAALSSGILAWLWINVLFFPRSGLFSWHLTAVFAVISIATVLIVYALMKHISLWPLKQLHKLYMPFVILFFVVSFLGHLLIGYVTMDGALAWNDPRIVNNDAIHYVETGQQNTHTGYLEDYFSHYPNNLGIVTLLAGVFTISDWLGIHDYQTVSMILNVVVLSLAQVVLFLIARKLYGKRVALLALFLSVPLITFSPYTAITYTDTLGILFPILLFYIYVLIRQSSKHKNRLVWVATLGVIAAIGYFIKPTTVIMLIAICLLEMLRILPWKVYFSKKRLIYFSVLMSSFLLCFVAITGAIRLAAVVPSNTSNAFPLLHWTAMGMVVNTDRSYIRYGAFSKARFYEMRDLPNKSARQDYALRIISQRLKEFGFTGYVKFLNNKAVWIMDDGSFYSIHYNIVPPGHFSHNDSIGGHTIQSFVSREGAYYKINRAIMQITWFIILGFIVLRSIQLSRTRFAAITYYEVTLYTSLMGLVAFILLTEGNPRYVYLYTPVFILLGASSISGILDINVKHNRSHNTHKRSPKVTRTGS